MLYRLSYINYLKFYNGFLSTEIKFRILIVSRYSVIESHKQRRWIHMYNYTFYCLVCALIIIAAIRRRIINWMPGVMHTRNIFGERASHAVLEEGRKKEERWSQSVKGEREGALRGKGRFVGRIPG